MPKIEEITTEEEIVENIKLNSSNTTAATADSSTTKSDIENSRETDNKRKSSISEFKELNINNFDDDDDESNEGAQGCDDEYQDCQPLAEEKLIFDEEKLKEIEKDLTEEEIRINKEKSENLKKEGNDLFKNSEYEKSIEYYTNALKIAPSAYPKERAILYANRAAAEIKLDSKNAAINDCTEAVKLNPEYIRAYLRRAKLFEEADKLDESFADYQKVVELDPGQHEAQAAVHRLPPIINERNEKLKTEMLGKLKDLGNMILKPFGLSTNNFKMDQDPNTGSYSINFQQNQNQ